MAVAGRRHGRDYRSQTPTRSRTREPGYARNRERRSAEYLGAQRSYTNRSCVTSTLGQQSFPQELNHLVASLASRMFGVEYSVRDAPPGKGKFCKSRRCYDGTLRV